MTVKLEVGVSPHGVEKGNYDTLIAHHHEDVTDAAIEVCEYGHPRQIKLSKGKETLNDRRKGDSAAYAN